LPFPHKIGILQSLPDFFLEIETLCQFLLVGKRFLSQKLPTAKFNG